jgi:hypothetical protein
VSRFSDVEGNLHQFRAHLSCPNKRSADGDAGADFIRYSQPANTVYSERFTKGAVMAKKRTAKRRPVKKLAARITTGVKVRSTRRKKRRQSIVAKVKSALGIGSK